jgi:uncharacterized repeat protein (TIGR03803 family)
LYGITGGGGSWSNGTVFVVNTDGTGFRTLHSFGPPNSEGAEPCNLILSSNTLYGTCGGGGPSGYGTVFAINTDGTDFRTLYSFSGSDGAGPSSRGRALALSGPTLYGTTAHGGSGWSDPSTGGYGTVFAINTDGTGFTTLYSFTDGTDGAYPNGVILSGGVLYGTTEVGGDSHDGTLFVVNTDGTGFATLHAFTGAGPCSSGCNGYASGPNTDGADPYCGIIASGTTLYGTAYVGGTWGNGTVFAVNTDGAGLKILHDFTPAPAPDNTNADGAQPMYSLVQFGTTVYGTTYNGGTFGVNAGIVFAVNTDGSGFTNLHSFRSESWPYDLVVSNDSLYGTSGGWGPGEVFSISLPVNLPQLTITRAGENLILIWPTNFTGFALQSTTNLSPSAIWTTNLPAPVVINEQNTVTNPISGAQQFFRLAQ